MSDEVGLHGDVPSGVVMDGFMSWISHTQTQYPPKRTLFSLLNFFGGDEARKLHPVTAVSGITSVMRLGAFTKVKYWNSVLVHFWSVFPCFLSLFDMGTKNVFSSFSLSLTDCQGPAAALLSPYFGFGQGCVPVIQGYQLPSPHHYAAPPSRALPFG